LLGRRHGLERAAKNLLLISLYETRMRRAAEKDTAALQAMQAKRKEAYARAQDKAIRLAQLVASQERNTTPATISSPPLLTSSSFFPPPICSVFWTAATACTRSSNLNKRPPTLPKAA
jgi:hypothetical protein